MISYRMQVRLSRSLLPIVGVGLWAVYLAVLLPLQRRETRLQGPLDAQWQLLAKAMGQSNAVRLDFQGIKDQLHQTTETKAILVATAQEFITRVDPGPELQQRLASSFQLVDYQNERGRSVERLTRLAKDEKVRLDPAVLTGFPEHTADVHSPELLWPALTMTEQLLTCAIHAHVAALKTLRFQSPMVSRTGPDQVSGMAEIVADIEMTGDAPKVLQFLAALPLRADEIHAAGLPEAGPHKPAMFIDQLVLRKRTPNRPDEVDVSIRVCTFVVRE